jgi:hypothetical protein
MRAALEWRADREVPPSLAPLSLRLSSATLPSRGRVKLVGLAASAKTPDPTFPLRGEGKQSLATKESSAARKGVTFLSWG